MMCVWFLSADVQALCPALDLLSSAIRDTHSESQSKQFSEQLLNITLMFLNTRVQEILSDSEGESLVSSGFESS